MDLFIRILSSSFLSILIVSGLGCSAFQQVIKPNPEQDKLLQRGLEQVRAENIAEGLQSFKDAVNAAKSSQEKDIALAILMSHQGLFATQSGNFEEAIGNFQQSLIHQQSVGDREAEAKTLTTLGNLYSYTGNYRHSVELYQQSLKIEQEYGFKSQEARTLLSFAGVTLRLRDYSTGLNQANQALRIAENLGNQELIADAHNILGVLARDHGDYPTAQSHYQKSLDANLLAGRLQEVTQNQINIGELQNAQGNLVEAKEIYQKILSSAQTNSNPLWRAIVKSYLGDVEIKRGRHATATKYYRDARSDFVRMKIPDRVARAELMLGIIEAEQKKYISSLSHYDLAIDGYRQLQDRQWLAEALYRRGRSQEKLGREKNAEDDYREAVELFESIRVTVPEQHALRTRFSEIHVMIYEALVDLLMRSNRVEEAIVYVQRSQTRALREMLEKNGISSNSPHVRELIDRYRDLGNREAELTQLLASQQTQPNLSPTRLDSLRKQLTTTREEFDQILLQISQEDTDLYNLLAVKPEDLITLANRLPKDSLPVAYFVTDHRTYIFFMDQGHLQARVVEINKERLKALVEKARAFTLRNASVDPSDWSDNGTIGYRAFVKPYKDSLIELYKLLFEPISDTARRYTRLVVIPFGITYYLPIHALAHNDKAGNFRFVIEDNEVIYLLPTNVTDQSGSTLKSGKLAINAFGSPDLNDPSLDLPSARVEVENIAELFPQAEVYTGSKATKENFIKGWEDASIIHIAAHGDLDPVKGPALLLAPAGTGRLGLAQISTLPSKHLHPIVALSACQTALNANDNNPTGSEISSVAFAFTRAGAGGVVATLWVVDDEATADLMKSVYRQVKKSNQLSYPFLRTAQLELIHGGGLHRQPFYWAPFIYYGFF